MTITDEQRYRWGAPSRADSRQIREWARANGYPISPKGRLPIEIIDAYDNRENPSEGNALH